MKYIKIFTSLGVYGSVRLLFSIFLSKICFPYARLVRFPFYVRREGNISIGKGFSANAGLVIDVYGKESKLEIGENVIANYRLHIGVCNFVSIGKNTLFGSDCLIMDHSHGSYQGEDSSPPSTPPNKRKLFTNPINIGINCWLGDKVSILPGVSIGDGVVIGAGSIVTKNLPSNTIAVGNPAKVIKKFDPSKKEWVPIRNKNK